MAFHPIAFGLGSNLGSPRKQLLSAVSQLGRWLSDPVAASLYRTAPVSEIEQPPYLNTALVGQTDLSPEAWLAIAKRLEQLAGRTLEARNAPRRLDIDLLLFGDETRDHAELTLPHPRLRERAFALVPLCEIVPDWQIPPDGVTIREALADLGDVAGVERLARLRL